MFPVLDSPNLLSDEVYDAAMEELKDPLIPTRGHALLQIARVIEARNPKALANSDKLLNMLMDNLCHEDTYIYLAAVQGLVSLSDSKHAIVIPCLAKEFAMFQNDLKVDAKEQGKYHTQGRSLAYPL